MTTMATTAARENVAKSPPPSIYANIEIDYQNAASATVDIQHTTR
jgi:hypothetical protein